MKYVVSVVIGIYEGTSSCIEFQRVSSRTCWWRCRKIIVVPDINVCNPVSYWIRRNSTSMASQCVILLQWNVIFPSTPQQWIEDSAVIWCWEFKRRQSSDRGPVTAHVAFDNTGVVDATATVLSTRQFIRYYIYPAGSSSCRATAKYSARCALESCHVNVYTIRSIPVRLDLDTQQACATSV